MKQVRITVTGFALILACACSMSPERARAEIDALELSFDEAGIGHAVLSGDPKLVKLFVTAGYDVNTFADARRAPLMLSTRLSHGPTVKTLIAAGARAEGLPGVLNLPAGQGDLETMAMLLDVGADIDSEDSARRTAILVAIDSGRIEAVRFLLDNGADPDGNRLHPGRGGTSPLIKAVMNNQPEMVELLIGAGADPRLSAGSTDAIRAAERAGRQDLAQRLREASAN